MYVYMSCCTFPYVDIFQALGKKSILLGLIRPIQRLAGVFQFFSQDFTDPIHKKEAVDNALRAISMHRYDVAAGFFLLADSLRDAVTVCLRQMQDIQLACILCRLVEGDQSPTLKQILEENVMDMAKEKKMWYVDRIK